MIEEGTSKDYGCEIRHGHADYPNSNKRKAQHTQLRSKTVSCVHLDETATVTALA